MGKGRETQNFGRFLRMGKERGGLVFPSFPRKAFPLNCGISKGKGFTLNYQNQEESVSPPSLPFLFPSLPLTSLCSKASMHSIKDYALLRTVLHIISNV